MLAHRPHRRFTSARAANTAASVGRCRIWCAIALYVLTSVVWPFEPVSASGTKIGQRSGCRCSAENKSNGTCCCAKSNKTVSPESPKSVEPPGMFAVSGKRCCAPVTAKVSPPESKSCCKPSASTTSKQPAPVAFGWNACDCPMEPGSMLAPVFQPRVCPQTELAWMPFASQAEFVAPTFCWIGAELDPPTPPPKIVL